MKKLFLFLVSLGSLSALTSHAQTCQSLTANLLKAGGNFLGDFQEFRQNAAAAFVQFVVPGTPKAEQTLSDLAESAIALETELLNAAGVVLGDGPMHVGPRYAVIPTKKVTGSNLITERVWITSLSPYDKVTVIIKKTGGKAGADIAVCAKYSSGATYNEKRKSIDKGEETKGDEVKFVFSDMNEKYLTIHLVQTGFVSNSMDYDLTIEGEFDEQAMIALNEKNKKESKSATSVKEVNNKTVKPLQTTPSKVSVQEAQPVQGSVQLESKTIAKQPASATNAESNTSAKARKSAATAKNNGGNNEPRKTQQKARKDSTNQQTPGTARRSQANKAKSQSGGHEQSESATPRMKKDSAHARRKEAPARKKNQN